MKKEKIEQLTQWGWEDYYNSHSHNKKTWYAMLTNGGFHSCDGVLYISKNSDEIKEYLLSIGHKVEPKQDTLYNINKKFVDFCWECYEFSLDYQD